MPPEEKHIVIGVSSKHKKFTDSLRSAVNLYFATDDLGAELLNLPTWIPVESFAHSRDDGKRIHLQTIRLSVPLFNSGVSLMVSMYIAYDETRNAFYYLPRREAFINDEDNDNVVFVWEEVNSEEEIAE